MGGLGGMGSRSSRSPFGDSMFGAFGPDTMFRSFGESAPSGVPKKAAPVESKLQCTLEELYCGSTRKMKISRNVMDASGKSMPVDEILTINVKPGWKKGTKITFAEKGNEQLNMAPADLVFVVDEKPHDVYKRDGNDLVVTHKISLAEALIGTTISLTTLDGRSLTIPVNEVISPGYEKVVAREGMPIPKEPGKKGNLRIKFDIKFPSRLTSEQKAGVKRLFSAG
ncbi:hypothetical protein KP509_22G016700 [Ceratopteris richardii]|nr:hypothetical protein KP509_22G016700 [Ceratopteris richardii]